MKLALIRNITTAIMLFANVSSHAVISTVCAAGCAYSDISSAVAGSAAGDILELTDSAYTESGIVIDKNLTIRGVSSGSPGAAIDAVGVNRIFEIVPPANLVILRSLKLANGSAPGVAGSDKGGAIWVRNGALRIFNSILVENHADQGGAIALEAGTRLTTEKSHFDGNNADRGGAIHCDSCDFVITRRSILDENSAAQGGAIYAFGTAILTNRSRYINNQASISTGGAIHAQATSIRSRSTTFQQNSANSHGGAIYAYGNDNYHMEIAFSAFLLNDASAGAAGGAIAIENAGGPASGMVSYISNSTFSRNIASAAGAIYSNNNPVHISNATFYENSSGFGDSGTFLGVTEMNNSIVINAPPILGVAIAPCNTAAWAIPVNSTYGGNLIDDPSGSCGLPHLPASNIDPVAVRPPMFPYKTAAHRPLPGSNAINAGTANCPHPQTGVPLVRDQHYRLRPVGMGCDVGSWEQ